MTTMDISFRYAEGLDEPKLQALARLSDVYGIRKLRIEEDRRTLAIEYDATRLDADRVEALVRGCGVATVAS